MDMTSLTESHRVQQLSQAGHYNDLMTMADDWASGRVDPSSIVIPRSVKHNSLVASLQICISLLDRTDLEGNNQHLCGFKHCYYREIKWYYLQMNF